MIKSGINHGDIVIVKQDVEPKKGDIVVALDDNGQTTLKRYLGIKNGCAILHPENDTMEDIVVHGKLSCQGKAVYVMKDLSGI
jgi:repressor LexA